MQLSRVDSIVQRFESGDWWYVARFEYKNSLDKTSKTTTPFEVANICLHSTDVERIVIRTMLSESRSYSIPLYRIASRRARPVSLEESSGLHRNAYFSVGSSNKLELRISARLCDSWSSTVLVGPCATNHCTDSVAVSKGIV